MKRIPGTVGKATFASLFALVTILSVAQLEAKEIYTWSDEDGVLNFSDLPPQGQEFRSMEISDPVALQGAMAAEEAEAATEPLTEGTLCAEHRNRLDTMLANRDVNYVDESGERQELSDEDYDLLIRESQTYLNLRCN